QAYRQPGSSFKPLVYATSIDYYGKNPSKETPNITAATQFLDSPLNYILEEGEEWTPENYSMDYSGFIRLREALVSSKNSVAVRVVEEIGLANLLPPLTNLVKPSAGREIPKNYSVALGTFEVSPYEITKAYAAIASGGREVFPHTIKYVKDKEDKVVLDNRNLETKEGDELLSPEASYIITSMMQDVIRKGTGKAIIGQGLTRPAAGKTGTTNNFRDAWFVGFTAQLVTSVWMGYDIGTLSLGRGMAGGVIAAPTWGKYMVKALKGEPVKDFNYGNLNIQKIKVCKLSGKRPGSSCKETITEYFIPGTLDSEVCEDHKGFNPFSMDSPNTFPDDFDSNSAPKKKKNKKKKQTSNLFKGDEKID
ncbi:MAG: carboxypeptidase, partial [Leptospiraceae bacterium]|nr:carboxypeptidase [Leptospiraceae bacterium]